MDASEPIYCEITHKLLARRNDGGIWLWCKVCKVEHYVAFEVGKNVDVTPFPSLEKNSKREREYERR